MRYLFIALLSITTWATQAQEASDEMSTAKGDAGEVPKEFKSLLKFDQRMIELGEVKHGDQREGSFTFTNVSEEDVQIEFISVCECTEANYPTAVIAPGESGKIDFTFDSTEKDESETINLDILLTNKEPSSGYQVVETVSYSYELVN